MRAWNECTLWDECIASEHMTVCNEYTECNSMCKFLYITRPITSIWQDHIIHIVIAYDTQLSTYHTCSQSFTYHIDSQVNNVIHISIMGSTYKNIAYYSHNIHVPTFTWTINHTNSQKSTLGLAKQPHSANSTRLSRISTLHNIYFTSHRHIQSL